MHSIPEREARASYVAAELHNPLCVYAYMVNGGTVYTAYFQLRCRQAIHSKVAKFKIAVVGNYLQWNPSNLGTGGTHCKCPD